MNCPDFDGHFSAYLADWARANQKKYKNADQMEMAMPEVYTRWLNEAADWLGGDTPGLFFAKYDDAEFLLRWIEAYIERGVSLPDPLTSRVAELGMAAIEPLTARLRADLPEELQMTALSLLQEIDEGQPTEAYLGLLAEHEGRGEVALAVAEALRGLGHAALGACLTAMEDAPRAMRLCLMEVATDYPGEERVTAHLIDLLRDGEDIALCAAYAARLGDPKVLRALREASRDPMLDYLTYVELSGAIEALGGEPLPEREFAGDPAYESLRFVK